MSVPKAHRPPKKVSKMKSGAKARRRGKAFQNRCAEYLGGKNRWPMQGVDIIHGNWSIECKSVDQQYPSLIEGWLQDAEIYSSKAFPENDAILVVHEHNSRIENAMVIMRASVFKHKMGEQNASMENKKENNTQGKTG